MTATSLYVTAVRPEPTGERVISETARRGLLASSASEDLTSGVFTYHNDWARTGQQLTETILTPATVHPDHFGLLKTDYRLDGTVTAQPLYAPNVHLYGMRGNVHNLVIVVTARNTVYAFDADVDRNPQEWASPLWTRSLLSPGATPALSSCNDLGPEIGITSTPVIDPNTGTLYVVAKSQEADGRQAFLLHALDLTTGLDQRAVGGPVLISATDPVTGPFDAEHQNQRAGLALVDGVVYVAFGSYCDQLPYHGWLLAYDVMNRLAPVAAFNTSPGDNMAGIWGSGAAPAIDANGSLFFATGNGGYSPADGHWGDSVLKMHVNRRVITRDSFVPLDYFSPFSSSRLEAADLDLGSSGLVLVPDQKGSHPHILVGGSKQGLIYVIDRDQMTVGNRHSMPCSDAVLAEIAKWNRQAQGSSYSDTCDPVVQVVKNVVGRGRDSGVGQNYQGSGVFGTPAFWNGSVYIGAANDQLKRFVVREGMLVNTPVSMSPNRFGWPGVTASISANGGKNGIVWVVASGEMTQTAAVLYAFDANDLSHVLYKSSGTRADERNGVAAPGGRDSMTVGQRFSLPTVYDGKVFVATRTHLYVFGLF